jgi:hypothetical protein
LTTFTPDTNINTLREALLSAEKAIDLAMRDDFDSDSCIYLAVRLSALSDLVLTPGETLPITIKDSSDPISKILMMHDVAYCLWTNDQSEVELPDDVFFNHAYRMRMNQEHRENVLKSTQLFLQKYNKTMSVELVELKNGVFHKL